jgi:hypothetical protein
MALDEMRRLQALLLAASEHALRLAVLVDEPAAQPEPGRPALAVAELDQPALASENFG